MRFILGLLLSAALSSSAPAQTLGEPYYMCFAYTPDGMYFAGGDFNFDRAQVLMAQNCLMPASLTVVLVKTLLVRKNGKVQHYGQ